jgi:hypothetical protein
MGVKFTSVPSTVNNGAILNFNLAAGAEKQKGRPP